MGKTLFKNGHVITVDAAFAFAEAVLIDDGVIKAVGADAEIRGLADADTQMIDLDGRTLMPGFIDTHGHVALFGLDELKVSLTGAGSKEEILQRIKARVSATSPGEWIVTMPIGEPPYFLNAKALRDSGVVPSRKELDAVAPDHPVYIQAPTNRVPNFAVLNSAAFAAAGISAGTEVSPNTKVRLDSDGEPTGIIEGAMQPIYNFDPLYQLVEQAAPRANYADIRNGIARLSAEFSKHGTTTLLEAHLTDPEELRAYAELEAAGQLPLRIFYTFEIDPRQSLGEIEQFLRTLRFAANGGFGS
ncbi:MAG: amidohydrolase family protein, partial [Pseudomonadota bacterium]